MPKAPLDLIAIGSALVLGPSAAMLALSPLLTPTHRPWVWCMAGVIPLVAIAASLACKPTRNPLRPNAMMIAAGAVSTAITGTTIFASDAALDPMYRTGAMVSSFAATVIAMVGALIFSLVALDMRHGRDERGY